jgi:hypothetical protein
MRDPRHAAPPAVPLVDARAVRLAQGLVATLIALAAVLQAWPLLALPAAHLAASALLGSRANVVGLAFDRLVRPRLAGDAPEDARPPRFASGVGAAVLAASLAAHAGGATTLGWSLAGVVAALALLSAATGLCVGCRLYWLFVLARRAGAPQRSR